MPVVVGGFGIVPKGLEKRLGELQIRRFKTIQTIVLLKSARILTKIPEKTYYFSHFSEKPAVKTGVKNLYDDGSRSSSRYRAALKESV